MVSFLIFAASLLFSANETLLDPEVTSAPRWLKNRYPILVSRVTFWSAAPAPCELTSGAFQQPPTC